jgi:excisionase family DNA binding protein
MSLTPKEVARKLGVHCGTVYRWINSKKLRARRRAGKYYEIEESDLAALYEEAGKKDTPAEEAARRWRERGFEVGPSRAG